MPGDPDIFAIRLADPSSFARSAYSDQLIAGMDRQQGEMEEKRRRTDFAERYQMMTGKFRSLVEDELRKLFKKQDMAAWVANTADAHVNVYRYVTDEIAAFPGAIRRFIKQDGTDDAVFDKIAKRVHFDLYLQEIARAIVGLNDCLVRVLPGQPDADDPSGEPDDPEVRLFYPHEVTVVPDPADPCEMAKVYYDIHDYLNGSKVTVVWTAKDHYQVTVDKQGKVSAPMPVDGATGTENPYGRLPFVAIHGGLRGDDFWDTETGDDRAQFHKAYLAAWSSIRWLMHQQGSLMLIREGADQDTEPFGYMGPGVELQVPVNQKVSVINLQASPMMQVEALHHALAEHLAQFGLNPEDLGMNPGQAPPSGIARAVQRRRLEDRRKGLRPFLEKGEGQFAELYRWGWNFNHDEQIDPDATFDVELLEEPVIESPAEKAKGRLLQLEVWDLERKLGMATREEQIAEDRNITPEAAKELAASIKVEPPATPLAVTGDPNLIQKPPVGSAEMP